MSDNQRKEIKLKEYEDVYFKMERLISGCDTIPQLEMFGDNLVEIFRKKDFSEKNILIKTAIFVFIFSVYYRLTEFLFKLPFGYRVPDVILFGTTYTYETTLPMIIVLW